MQYSRWLYRSTLYLLDAVNEEGQYQAIKYLFEMIGSYPASADDDSVPEDSFARRYYFTWDCRNPSRQSRRRRDENSQRPIP